MRLSRITKIKRHRVFRDFTWPRDLPAFAQFNLIYGWNATGKTTLAYLLRHLEQGHAITEGEVEFELDTGAKISEAQIPTATLPPVRVFNRESVAKTVECIGNGSVPPIYFLGESSVEQQKQVKQFRKELEAADGEVIKANNAKTKDEKALDEFCIEKAKLIKDALLGSADHSNYDKRRFKESMQRLKAKTQQPKALSDEDKQRLRKQKDLSAKPDIDEVTAGVPDLVTLRSVVMQLLNRSVTSQALDELVEDPEVGQWVQTGLRLHQGERETDKCRFCGNLLDVDRRSALEAHFDDAFASFQRELEQENEEIKKAKKALSDASFPDESRFYDHLEEEAKQAIGTAKRSTQPVADELDRLQVALEAKKTRPFERVDYDEKQCDPVSAVEQLQQAIDAVNDIIRKHQAVTNNLKSEAKKACAALEQNFVLDALPRFDELLQAQTNARNEAQAVRETQTELKGKITEIERQLVEHRRPAEELNRELTAYLGRDDLQFEVEDTGYRLIRSGHPASHLSEGERTAIAFLYFLKSLEDKDFDLNKGIVVVDDPVSSLDANALFSAFGYMKERTKECHQLFILTHNFAFFRQVKNWFHHLPKQRSPYPDRRPGRFYTLVALKSDGQRNASLIPMDPLLEQYQSEYHYLFKQVYDSANLTASGDSLARHYGMPNVARRLIETFLAYRVPDESGDLIKRLDRVEFDAAKKTQILRFLNTYSHGSGISQPEHDPTILAETQEVMKLVLELMQSVDKPHYEGMEHLVQKEEAVDE